VVRKEKFSKRMSGKKEGFSKKMSAWYKKIRILINEWTL